MDCLGYSLRVVAAVFLSTMEMVIKSGLISCTVIRCYQGYAIAIQLKDARISTELES